MESSLTMDRILRFRTFNECLRSIVFAKSRNIQWKCIQTNIYKRNKNKAKKKRAGGPAVFTSKWRSMKGTAAALFLACIASPAIAFYLPGVAPKAFKDGEKVNMKVQTLVSPETPLQFDYYQLPFCQPDKVRSGRFSLNNCYLTRFTNLDSRPSRKSWRGPSWWEGSHICLWSVRESQRVLQSALS